MLNNLYKVKRDKIYVGEVIQIDQIGHSRDTGEIQAYGYTPCRSILFELLDNKTANDLLYQSANYEVFDLMDEDRKEKQTGAIVVKNIYSLSTLLKYYGYKEVLAHESILDIRKKFFSGHFAKDNCDLFGYKEIEAEDLSFTDPLTKERITDPKRLSQLILARKKAQAGGNRMFSYSGKKSALPKEYWDVLDERGNNDLLDIAMGTATHFDSFKPNKKIEGPIKRLKRPRI